MSFLIISMVFLNDFSNTEIYKPLNTRQVAISESGNVFILDRDENRVLIYDNQGSFRKTFGQKGEGPGEFNRVYWIKVMQGQLYVHDRKGLSVFNLEGDFKERVVSSGGRTNMEPVQNGWLVRKYSFNQEKNSSLSEFCVLDMDQNELLVLGEYSREMEVFSSKNPTMKFNPVEVYPNCMTDQTGTYIVSKGKEDFPITIYKMVPMPKKVFEIKLSDRKVIPFNEEWADGILTKIQKTLKDVSYEADYPKSFPLVQGVGISPDNQLAISLWSKDPDKPETLLYDWTGKLLPRTYTPTFMFRVLFIRDEIAYVGSYDEENEDYILKKMPVKDCAKYIEQFPYTEDFDY